MRGYFLSDSQKEEIYRQHQAKQKSYRELARQYGVCHSSIARICYYRIKRDKLQIQN